MLGITKIRVTIAECRSSDQKLIAFVEIRILYWLVIKDLKIVAGLKGLVVSMPDRKVVHPCPECNEKNATLASFCNKCGHHLPRRSEDVARYASVAFPIIEEARVELTKMILDVYEEAKRENLKYLEKDISTLEPSAVA